VERVVAVGVGASPHPSSSFGFLKPGVRPNAALYSYHIACGTTTLGLIAGPRLDCGEVSNFDMTWEYFDPLESATLFMIVAGSRSASDRAVI
jgi:hypothetical protein